MVILWLVLGLFVLLLAGLGLWARGPLGERRVGRVQVGVRSQRTERPEQSSIVLG